MKTINNLVIYSMLIVLMLPLHKNYAEEEVYGWSMMNEQERNQHRETMRSFTTDEERERYRIEHHKKMQQRAKERGLTIPDNPHERMRDGSGMGSGMGGGKGR